MIIFNYLAAGILIVALMIGYGIQAMTGPIGDGNTLAVFITLGLASLFDAVYRWRQTEESAWRFLWPSTGGHVMFIPVWAFAVYMVFDVVFEIT